jgi:hypothetical protein
VHPDYQSSVWACCCNCAFSLWIVLTRNHFESMEHMHDIEKYFDHNFFFMR